MAAELMMFDYKGISPQCITMTPQCITMMSLDEHTKNTKKSEVGKYG